MFENVWAVYFSGTGTTEKTVTTVAKEIGKKKNLSVKIFDFTKPKNRENDIAFTEKDIVVFGMPVIAGRVPNLMLKFLNNKIDGGGAIGVPVVLYGNRNFDDGLIELRDILEDDGFKTVAAGAFVGEHSFSNILGKDRPDEKDLGLAENLGDKVAKIASLLEQGGEVQVPVQVPGVEKPYREYYKPRDRYGKHIDIRKVKPKTDKEKCVNCKLCVNICPLGSIDFDDVSQITGICMKCCGCVKKCPQGAKYFDDPGYIYHKEELEAMYQRYGESQIFSGTI